jgi:hypothetical protein
MPFVRLLDGYRVSFVYDFAGEACQNSVWFSGPTSSQVACERLAANMLGSWSTQVMPLLNPLVRLDSVVVVDWSSQFGFVAIDVPTGTVVGGQAGPCEANNVAFCMSLRTQARGRSFRGRIYLPGITTTILQDTNHVTVLWADNLRAAVEQALQIDPPSDFFPIIASFQVNGVARADGLGTPLATVLYTDTTLDSMRRRLPGRGR